MCDLRTTMNEMEQRYSFNADPLPERLVRQTLFRANRNEMEQRYSFNADPLPERLVRQTLFRANRLLMEAYTEILELDSCFKD